MEIRVAKSEFHQNETKKINILSPIKNTIVGRCLSLVAVKIQNHRGTEVFHTFLWNYDIFFMKLSVFFYKTIQNCNNIRVNLRQKAHVFQLWWICAEVWWTLAKKKNIFFFFTICETVISFIFFNETTDFFLFRKREIVHDTRFIALFYVKNEVSVETTIIIFFLISFT